MSILSASSSCVHLLPSVGLLFSLLCVCGGGKGEGSLASLVSEWASGIRLYSSLLAAVLHPYCGIFSPFLSNRGQRSRRSPPNLACHSTRRRYELRSTQIDMLKSMPDMIVKLRFSWWIMQIRSSHCQCRSNDFADRSADPIRSDPIVRFISIVLLGPQVQMVQLGKWRSVESESARSAAGRVECVKAAPLLRAVTRTSRSSVGKVDIAANTSNTIIMRRPFGIGGTKSIKFSNALAENCEGDKVQLLSVISHTDSSNSTSTGELLPCSDGNETVSQTTEEDCYDTILKEALVNAKSPCHGHADDSSTTTTTEPIYQQPCDFSRTKISTTCNDNKSKQPAMHNAKNGQHDCKNLKMHEGQEWVFTLYDFDGKGKVSKADILSLVRSIYDVLGSAKLPMRANVGAGDTGNPKTSGQPMGAFKIKLSVVPDGEALPDGEAERTKNASRTTVANGPRPLASGRPKGRYGWPCGPLQAAKSKIWEAAALENKPCRSCPHRNYVNLSELESCCRDGGCASFNAISAPRLRHCDRHCHCPPAHATPRHANSHGHAHPATSRPLLAHARSAARRAHANANEAEYAAIRSCCTNKAADCGPGSPPSANVDRRSTGNNNNSSNGYYYYYTRAPTATMPTPVGKLSSSERKCSPALLNVDKQLLLVHDKPNRVAVVHRHSKMAARSNRLDKSMQIRPTVAAAAADHTPRNSGGRRPDTAADCSTGGLYFEHRHYHEHHHHYYYNC
ncbi:Protein naked cuticle -like protein 1 [Trichinella nativa]|uniref:Protein naked cuticle homolog n=1 Tax=Trichinella nativa TaxID=6335 RepID=A0A0V1L652_9BILA|nr:Protein naked cuticle -like protein 1 [Trichinella nativa]